jgi:hypothetical protein
MSSFPGSSLRRTSFVVLRGFFRLGFFRSGDGDADENNFEAAWNRASARTAGGNVRPPPLPSSLDSPEETTRAEVYRFFFCVRGAAILLSARHCLHAFFKQVLFGSSSFEQGGLWHRVNPTHWHTSAKGGSDVHGHMTPKHAGKGLLGRPQPRGGGVKRFRCLHDSFSTRRRWAWL